MRLSVTRYRKRNAPTATWIELGDSRFSSVR